ncbi:MAG TPA: nitrilase-related carbon-nitrogen hydrolase [Fibrobacteria bacterium]|nr:nitrilase-related carbon-nitrogen hydrolase [Fibrobacteria bacterium]HOX50033.1 nitrilase-related carbon-nitrogen hydrolase [Fibrobacteria bacterium]
MILRLGAAALATTPLDFSGNLDLAREALRQARQDGVQILCLPELWISGYGCEDMFLSAWVAERALASLLDFAREVPDGMLATAGLPLRVRGRVHNACALVGGGKVLGLAAKRHLAREGIHYEPRWFTPWTPGLVETHPQLGCPVGDQIFEWNGVRIGFEICEDAWAAGRPGLELAAADCDVVLCPSASHFALGKDQLRARLVADGSRSLGTAFVWSNLSGNEAGRAIYDASCRIASCGRILSEGDRLTFRKVSSTAADVDLEEIRTHRAVSGHPVYTQPPRVTPVDLPMEPPAGDLPRRDERPPMDPRTEFARATALAMWDYLRKTRAKGFVLSLSGGADSAACAVLSHLAFHWALEDLGEDGFRRCMSHLDLPHGTLTARRLAGELLLCAYQATRNSGNVTLQAAKAVAEGTGAVFRAWDVDALVEGYRRIAEDALERKLSWSGDDIALQNIQARVRAPSVWMLANALDRLLITTSNRSEMAVGYATMDGDTAGSLSPLAGIDKHFLLGWLSAMESGQVVGAPAMPCLHAITAQTPTAELRPREDGTPEQTDENDLMPYPLLSRLETLAIRDRKSPRQCLHELSTHSPWADDPRLKTWVGRFFRLWTRNQWKRERYAPSFHLDRHDLDPRAGTRFPILSAGFSEELAELGI